MTRAFALALVVFVSILAIARPALAHQAGLSRGEYAVAGNVIDARVVFTNSEIASSIASLDPDHDGHVSMAEIDAHKTDLDAALVKPLVIQADGDACASSLEDARIAEADGLLVVAKYTCSHPPKHLTIIPGFLDRFSFTHRHIAEISASGKIEELVAVPANPTIDVDVEAGPAPSSSTSTSTSTSTSSSTSTSASTSTFVPLFKMGILHILTGYDHLAFLFGLVLVGGRKRALIALVTAFTLAHSLTLGLATLHIVEPPSSIIEPAIALSIAYVGVENFFVKNAEHRWKITFPFGLIHGFGFAAALQEIALPRQEVPVALFAFNLGVEAGQLAVLALLLPILHFARKNAAFRDKGVKGLSVAVTAAGSIWFVLRVASAVRSGA